MEQSSPHWLSQGHAEDVLLWHRYNYYVLGCGLISDAAYDALERGVLALWSVGVASTVGSSDVRDYPAWVIERRRPDKVERGLRDKAIAVRWVNALCG